MKTNIGKYTGSVCLTLLIFFGLVVGLSSVSAEEIVGGTIVVGAPPDDCDADAKGEEILLAAKNMTNAHCDTAAIVMSDRTGFFTASVKAQLDDQCTRSNNWLNAEGRSSDFAKSGKKGSAECYIVEREDGVGNNGDGICTPNEKYNKKDDVFGCEENNTDGIGNDDGICELLQKGHGKKVWEKCLEVCDTPVDNPAVTDCSTMDQMAGSLQDAADALESANTQIAAKLQVLEAMQEAVVKTSSSPTVSVVCPTASSVSFDGFSFPSGLRSSGYIELRDALLAAKILEEVANICVDIMDTSAFGFDLPAVCGVPHAGQAAATIIAEGWKLLDDAITGARVDKMSICLEELSAGQDLVLEKLDTIMEFLNTPQGRRPDFPVK